MDIAKGKPLEKPKDPPLLNQVECEYVPHILVAPVGGHILLGNDDNHLHSIHGTLDPSGDTVFNIAQPIRGMRERRPIKRAGIIELMCHPGHTWMSGYIMAVNHPYYALTGDDGTFEITDVPPGSYTLRAWHEGWNVVGQVTHADTSGDHHAAAFERPRVIDKQIQLKPKETVEVNFELSDLSKEQLAREKEQARIALAQQVTDHVCGMSIDPKSATATMDYKGRKFYFCSVACKKKFAAAPDAFLEARGRRSM